MRKLSEQSISSKCVLLLLFQFFQFLELTVQDDQWNLEVPQISRKHIVFSSFHNLKNILEKKIGNSNKEFADYTRRFAVSKMLSVLRSLYRFQTLHKK